MRLFLTPTGGGRVILRPAVPRELGIHRQIGMTLTRSQRRRIKRRGTLAAASTVADHATRLRTIENYLPV